MGCREASQSLAHNEHQCLPPLSFFLFHPFPFRSFLSIPSYFLKSQQRITSVFLSTLGLPTRQPSSSSASLKCREELEQLRQWWREVGSKAAGEWDYHRRQSPYIGSAPASLPAVVFHFVFFSGALGAAVSGAALTCVDPLRTACLSCAATHCSTRLPTCPVLSY